MARQITDAQRGRDRRSFRPPPPRFPQWWKPSAVPWVADFSRHLGQGDFSPALVVLGELALDDPFDDALWSRWRGHQASQDRPEAALGTSPIDDLFGLREAALVVLGLD